MYNLHQIPYWFWFVASFAASSNRWEMQKTKKSWVMLSATRFLFNILGSLYIFQYDWILPWAIKMIYYLKYQGSGMSYLWKCPGIKICLVIVFLPFLILYFDIGGVFRYLFCDWLPYFYLCSQLCVIITCIDTTLRAAFSHFYFSYLALKCFRGLSGSTSMVCLFIL